MKTRKNLANRKRKSSTRKERRRLFPRKQEHRKEGFFVRFVVTGVDSGSLASTSKERTSSSLGFSTASGETF